MCSSDLYPYVVGPTFYGNKTAAKVTTISEAVTTYSGGNPSSIDSKLNNCHLIVFPNPANEFIALQADGLVKNTLRIDLYDMTGKHIISQEILPGSTINYLDVRTLYSGEYIVKISDGKNESTTKVVIQR